MCNQFTLHHKFRIDTGRTNFEQGKTDGILYGCKSHGQGTQRSVQAWPDQTTSCMVQTENVEKTPRHGVLGRYTACWTERIEVLSNKIESQLIVSRNRLGWNLKKLYTRRYMCHLDHHRKFPAKIIGCAIWILMLLEAAKTPHESNQNQKPNYQVRGDPYVERKRKSRNLPRLIATLWIKRNMMKS